MEAWGWERGRRRGGRRPAERECGEVLMGAWEPKRERAHTGPTRGWRPGKGCAAGAWPGGRAGSNPVPPTPGTGESHVLNGGAHSYEPDRALSSHDH